jgi:hypothetical protein
VGLAGRRLALGARLDLGDEAHVVELDGRGRVLDSPRLFVAPMATLLDHGLSRDVVLLLDPHCTARRSEQRFPYDR